ncbi:MAG: pantoate--beta-alanine ligase [Chitinispirillaceae bacterium]|nr:pantoate--beta-alanine ligase [Chitinispirillaceae bacterium]
MNTIRYPSGMKKWSDDAHKKGRTIGFIPTMGALHEGHLSIIKKSKDRADVTVMSIFVNPVQFCPGEDFKRYPRQLGQDLEKARAAGCDAVFVPETTAIYPDGYCTYVTVEGLDNKLCGAARPGHFRGVATVVLKLFNIVAPDTAFFGLKDAQQAVILKRMAADLNLPVKIIVCPTVREADGLAMSSRNAYLTPAERAAAPVMYQGLNAARSLYQAGERDAARLISAVETVLGGTPLIKKDYIEVVDATTLDPLTTVTGTALIAAACRTRESGTRLIDNLTVGGTW